MRITDLYKTEISVHYADYAADANNGLGVECYEYDLSNFVDISSNHTNIKIAVRLKDFNNANVTDKTVTLKCSDGYFTTNNGTLIKDTTTNSISLNIINGLGVADWTTTNVGLVTFSANEAKTSILVTGIKTIIEANGITFKVNELTRTAALRLYLKDKDFKNMDKWYLTTNGNITQNSKPVIIPEKYRPATPTVIIHTNGRTAATGLIHRNTNATDTAGTITLLCGTSTGVQTFHGYATWMF